MLVDDLNKLARLAKSELSNKHSKSKVKVDYESSVNSKLNELKKELRKTDNGCNIFTYLINHENIEINTLDFLYSKRYIENINEADSNGMCPIHYMAKNGNDTILQWLIKHKAVVNCLSKEGLTPLYYAINSNSLSTLKIIKDRNPDYNLKGLNVPDLIHYAIDNNSGEEMLEAIWKEKINKSEKDELLHYAVRKNNEIAVKFLLKKNADINSHIENVYILDNLWKSDIENKDGMEKLLLRAGANVSLLNESFRKKSKIAGKLKEILSYKDKISNFINDKYLSSEEPEYPKLGVEAFCAQFKLGDASTDLLTIIAIGNMRNLLKFAKLISKTATLKEYEEIIKINPGFKKNLQIIKQRILPSEAKKYGLEEIFKLFNEEQEFSVSEVESPGYESILFKVYNFLGLESKSSISII